MDKNKDKSKKKKSNNLKCITCENYDKKADFCFERQIENCSKHTPTEFSKCDSYLVNQNLVMF